MKMNKKVLIVSGIVIFILAIIICAVIIICINNARKISSITITFNESYETEDVKKIVIEDKAKIKELTKYLKTVKSSEKVDNNLALYKEIIIDFGNNTNIIIQTTVDDYCFYEDNDTQKLVNMPSGLLNMIKKELKIEDEQ